MWEDGDVGKAVKVKEGEHRIVIEEIRVEETRGM